MSYDKKTAAVYSDYEVAASNQNVVIFSFKDSSGNLRLVDGNGTEATKLSGGAYSAPINYAKEWRDDITDDALWSLPWPSSGTSMTVRVTNENKSATYLKTDVTLIPRVYAPDLTAAHFADDFVGESDDTYFYGSYWIPWGNGNSTHISSLQRPVATVSVQLDPDVVARDFGGAITLPLDDLERNCGAQLFLRVPKSRLSFSVTVNIPEGGTISKVVKVIDTRPPLAVAARKINPPTSKNTTTTQNGGGK